MSVKQCAAGPVAAYLIPIGPLRGSALLNFATSWARHTGDAGTSYSAGVVIEPSSGDSGFVI